MLEAQPYVDICVRLSFLFQTAITMRMDNQGNLISLDRGWSSDAAEKLYEQAQRRIRDIQARHAKGITQGVTHAFGTDARQDAQVRTEVSGGWPSCSETFQV